MELFLDNKINKFRELKGTKILKKLRDYIVLEKFRDLEIYEGFYFERYCELN